MRVFKILKKNKKDYRTIYAQNNSWERKKYRSLGMILEGYFFTLKNNHVVQGFVPMKNCVTNASKHINKQYTMSIDLKSFFDYVSPKKIQTALSQYSSKINIQSLSHAVTYKGRARQGLSSSPMSANIAASPLDDAILDYIQIHDKDCVYTRYADDLTFSSDDISFLKKLRIDLNKIVKNYKFKINHTKTRIQSAKFGRRMITGIAIDDEGCHPTRSNKRKIRALKFKLSKETDIGKREYYQRIINGLEEFNKCKLPNKVNNNPTMKLQMWTEHINWLSNSMLKPEWLNNHYFINNLRRLDLIHKIGIEKCLKYLKMNVIDTYGNYELMEIFVQPDNRSLRRVYLKMLNPSVPGLFHIEGVDPNCINVQDAINYRRYGNLDIINAPWLPIVLT